MSNNLIIFIPALLDSQNRNNTKHWTQVSRDKKNVKDIVIEQLSKVNKKFEKVVLHFQPILGTEIEEKAGKKVRNKTARDITNNSPSVKYFEDLIVRSGILKDDTNDYVIKHVCYKSITNRNFKGHGMLIMIEEVDSDQEVADCFLDYYNDLAKNNYIDVKELKKSKNKTKKNEDLEKALKDAEIKDLKLKNILKNIK